MQADPGGALPAALRPTAGRHSDHQPRLLATVVVLALTSHASFAAQDPANLPPHPDSTPQPPLIATAIPSDEDLERSGAVIGEIEIDNQNIFDLNDPKDNTALFRLANRLHPRTRRNVIRDQLLFHTGDRYSRRILNETERILRADEYFYDAWIVPVRYADGKVDVRITTRDVWTLNPGFNYSRTGGTNSTGFQIEELNTLGSGTAVSLSHSTEVDRSSSMLEAYNNHAFGTWVQVDAAYSELSDGSLRRLIVNRPFYSLNTHYAGGVSTQTYDHTDSLYDRGQVIDKFQDDGRFTEIYGGWSHGLDNGWVSRWTTGFTYDERRFASVSTWTGPTLLPQDRKLVYPWIRFDILQDNYQKLMNHDQIGRTEDFYLGTTASVRLGWADTALGSTRSGAQFQLAAGQGVGSWDRSTLLMSGLFTGRLEEGIVHNGVLSGAVRYYNKQSSNWLFFTTLQAAKGWRLDLDNQLLLGGDNGLRGYPLRYQDGTGRALLTIEQRYFTDWYPFRLLRVGGAIFFDAGRTWGNAPLATPSLGLLKDVGFGLRFGNSRSGLGNVVHVDLAFPLTTDRTIDKVQFLVQTEERF